MSMKKTALIFVSIFVLLSPLLFLLLSYQSTAFQEKYYSAPEQKEVLYFLQENTEMKENFTALEISHLQDVQKVMRSVNYLFYLILTLAIILGIFLYRQALLSKALFYSSIVSLSLFALIFIFYFFGFSSLFTVFHQVFFPQGNWQFSADSLLINTFPFEFFTKLSGIIFGKAAALAAIALLLSVYPKNKETLKNRQ